MIDAADADDISLHADAAADAISRRLSLAAADAAATRYAPRQRRASAIISRHFRHAALCAIATALKMRLLIYMLIICLCLPPRACLRHATYAMPLIFIITFISLSDELPFRADATLTLMIDLS